jgi:hypothetical protein
MYKLTTLKRTVFWATRTWLSHLLGSELFVFFCDNYGSVCHLFSVSFAISMPFFWVAVSMIFQVVQVSYSCFFYFYLFIHWLIDWFLPVLLESFRWILTPHFILSIPWGGSWTIFLRILYQLVFLFSPFPWEIHSEREELGGWRPVLFLLSTLVEEAVATLGSVGGCGLQHINRHHSCEGCGSMGWDFLRCNSEHKEDSMSLNNSIPPFRSADSFSPFVSQPS